MFYNQSIKNQILSYIAIFNHHFTGAVWWNRYLDILETIQNFFPLLLTHQYYFWNRWFFFCKSNIWPTNVINFSSRLFINMNIDGIIRLVNQLMNTNLAYWTLYFFYSCRNWVFSPLYNRLPWEWDVIWKDRNRIDNITEFSARTSWLASAASSENKAKCGTLEDIVQWNGLLGVW